jgi:hypothetical protein
MFATTPAPASTYHPSTFDPKTMTHAQNRRGLYRPLIVVVAIIMVIAGVYAGITAFSSKVPVNATPVTTNSPLAP